MKCLFFGICVWSSVLANIIDYLSNLEWIRLHAAIVGCFYPYDIDGLITFHRNRVHSKWLEVRGENDIKAYVCCMHMFVFSWRFTWHADSIWLSFARISWQQAWFSSWYVKLLTFLKWCQGSCSSNRPDLLVLDTIWGKWDPTSQEGKTLNVSNRRTDTGSSDTIIAISGWHDIMFVQLRGLVRHQRLFGLPTAYWITSFRHTLFSSLLGDAQRHVRFLRK